jgi:Bifunctional DNA primase/polymerase, N-terminal
MTQKERLEQLQLAQAHLGRVFPLWGVVQGPDGALRCECRQRECKGAGKHPRPLRGGWQKNASDDPATLIEWTVKYPLANFGVVTGERSFGLDVDVRREKNGLAELELLEFDVGRRTPHTVMVTTGRDNGSHHRYFQVPAMPIRNRASFLPGLDVRNIGGYCVAPGSRHVSGGFYRFAEECRPDETPLAVLPDFLLDLVPPKASRVAVVGLQTPHSEPLDLSGREGPDEPLPDGVVLGVLKRDKVARFYWDGGRKPYQSPSEDDFALACKLAFYCRHNLPQMYRLFMKSGLFRPKFLRKSKHGNYALRTLENAIVATPARWKQKKRVRKSKATGAKPGRKISPKATAILKLRHQQPNLKPLMIALLLDTTVSKVRDVLRYHGNRISSLMPTENAEPLIHIIPMGTGKVEPTGSKYIVSEGVNSVWDQQDNDVSGWKDNSGSVRYFPFTSRLLSPSGPTAFGNAVT